MTCYSSFSYPTCPIGSYKGQKVSQKSNVGSKLGLSGRSMMAISKILRTNLIRAKNPKIDRARIAMKPFPQKWIRSIFTNFENYNCSCHITMWHISHVTFFNVALFEGTQKWIFQVEFLSFTISAENDRKEFDRSTSIFVKFKWPKISRAT